MAKPDRSKGCKRRRRLLPIDEAMERKRLALKLTQRAAAERLGVSQANYHNWCRCGKLPNALFLPQISTFLGATIDEASAMRALMAERQRREREAAEIVPPPPAGEPEVLSTADEMAGVEVTRDA